MMMGGFSRRPGYYNGVFVQRNNFRKKFSIRWQPANDQTSGQHPCDSPSPLMLFRGIRATGRRFPGATSPAGRVSRRVPQCLPPIGQGPRLAQLPQPRVHRILVAPHHQVVGAAVHLGQDIPAIQTQMALHIEAVSAAGHRPLGIDQASIRVRIQ